MRIGIPRGLLYFRYGEFWQRFFSYLGIEVLTSPSTNKSIVELGLRSISSEICFPVKVLMGHIQWLLDRVDYIFLPRMVYLQKGSYGCPKMIGIADVARLYTNNILAPSIKGNFFLPHFTAGIKLTKDPIRVYRAYHKAYKESFEEKGEPEFPSDRLKIALLSHFYLTLDEYISRPIIKTLEKEGAFIYTKEDLPENILLSLNKEAERVHWVYERELYNAFRYYLPRVDGICQMLSFNCGPDSLVGDLIQREARDASKPFLSLLLDEHTAEAGIITRLEAFMDTIKRR